MSTMEEIREEAFYAERDERARIQAEERAEDERAEWLAKEMAFVEYNACTEACFATCVHHAGCIPSGEWSAAMAVAKSWAAAMGLKEAA